MSQKESKYEIKKFILSGYPLIYVRTDDERPVIETVKTIAKNNHRNHHVFTWNSASGLVREDGSEKDPSITTPQGILNFIKNYAQHDALFILHDFHVYFDQSDIVVYLKDAVHNLTIPMTDEFLLKRYETAHNYIYKHIIITSPVQRIPEELNKMISVVEFGLPGKEEIRDLFDKFTRKSKENKFLSEEEKNKIISACIGLTEAEIFNACSKSMVLNNGKVNYKDITSEKSQIIKKDGMLEFFEPSIGLSDVGGLKNLTAWVKKRKLAYDEDIRVKHNLEMPKGLLMTGIQGCGKSHSVKAISNFLEVPLIRMDVGSLMGKWLGESEGNIRRAIRLAENIAPCVLWIDEIDKGIPDPSSGNAHETTKRVFSTLLTWLQEKTSAVFVVATANNIHHLPPELMRKGRFDEIFFIDLPNLEERKEIFGIHLNKKGFSPEKFDVETLASVTEGYSGAEIQVLIGESMFEAVYKGQQLETVHLLDEVNNTEPLSVTMKDKVDSIRSWAQSHNIRPASS